ncbi:hypothetical protein Syncc9605_2482 [Synechococcus sp. CC9605]|nr:hypothetical protein Syncc9605_2482 [Synechococcus sp. CC9605]
MDWFILILDTSSWLTHSALPMVLMTLNTAPLNAQYSWEYLCVDCNPPEWQLLNFAYYEKAKDMCKLSRTQLDYILSIKKERVMSLIILGLMNTNGQKVLQRERVYFSRQIQTLIPIKKLLMIFASL